jgi:hypothetical protein
VGVWLDNRAVEVAAAVRVAVARVALAVGVARAATTGVPCIAVGEALTAGDWLVQRPVAQLNAPITRQSRRNHPTPTSAILRRLRLPALGFSPTGAVSDHRMPDDPPASPDVGMLLGGRTP